MTALALTTTGPNPARGRVLRIAALHVIGTQVVERFSVVLNPRRRVPRYAAERAGHAPDGFEALPAFDDSLLDDLLRFLDERPVWAQEVGHAWSFIEAETHRLQRTLLEPPLVDVNLLASAVLEHGGKPNLAVVARQLGVSFTRIDQPDEEARVISLVLPRLLDMAAARGTTTLEAFTVGSQPGRRVAPLRRAATARALPEEPGVYVMRDAEQGALYVGKARRLRSRMTAYVHRPLGATRRLEGLADEVERVESALCATDLEALILEDREIRRLEPRFNTQRRQRAPRTWIRLPALAVDPLAHSKRRRAPSRLELAQSPASDGAAFLGPFRNEMAAEHARSLARAVFDLDHLRRAEPIERYVDSVTRAWAFLNGENASALELVRHRHASAVAMADHTAARHWSHVRAAVRDYDPGALLLPADPRESRYAVLRLSPTGLEGLLIERGVLLGSCTLETLETADFESFASHLLEANEPRTEPADVDVVLRWFGSQRPPARLVHIDDGTQIATARVAVAAMALGAEVLAAAQANPTIERGLA